MGSPCLTCEFKNQSKEACTKAGSYCQKLLRYQVQLDKQVSAIKTNDSFSSATTYAVNRNGQVRKHMSTEM